MCQGFNTFSCFLQHFVLTKLATSSIRVKILKPVWHSLGFKGLKSEGQALIDSAVFELQIDSCEREHSPLTSYGAI